MLKVSTLPGGDGRMAVPAALSAPCYLLHVAWLTARPAVLHLAPPSQDTDMLSRVHRRATGSGRV